MARLNPYLIGGAGLLGWFLYSALKNKAQAGVPSPQSAANAPYGVPPAGAYTPAALDASVPGVSFAPSTLQPGVLASTLTAVPAVTGQQVAQAQSFWSTLQPVNPPDTGYITFPSGSQVAASLLTGGNTRIDGAGNYYVLWGGQVYQLGAMDSSGNWPTQVVTG